MEKRKQKHTRTKKEFESVSITETKDFGGKIVLNRQTGRNELKINAPMWYAHQLQKFRVGEKVSLYISSRRPKRSEQQNRYYWGVVLPAIAHETGERDLDRLHRLFSGKFLTTGIETVLGEKVRMVRSTTTLSKAEFFEYILAIEGDTGITAPPPQNYFDS